MEPLPPTCMAFPRHKTPSTAARQVNQIRPLRCIWLVCRQAHLVSRGNPRAMSHVQDRPHNSDVSAARSSALRPVDRSPYETKISQGLSAGTSAKASVAGSVIGTANGRETRPQLPM
jgi:hypothetical protein